MTASPENEVSRLFDEYVDAREADRSTDRSQYVLRAGSQGEELLRRIRAYESIEDMASEISGRPLEDKFGRYEILRLVGSGGLGEVYLARDPDLNREVALKVLDRGQVGLRESRIVLNEARALARLEHPGVVRVFEVGEVDGRFYVAMEYLQAPSLSQVLAEMRRRSSGREAEGDTALTAHAARLESTSARTRLLQVLADALAYSHDRGVLHRDVKPSNVLIDDRGQPRLIDFGLAHVDDSSQEASADFTQRFVGTPAYAAPEQIAAQRTGDDPRSDQFSFGSLAYELYTLENPFQRGTHTATLDAVAASAPARLGSRLRTLPRDAERVVHHCLEQDPDDRYPDMQAVAADLEAVLTHTPIALAEPTLAHALQLWTRRHRARLLWSSALGMGLILVLTLASLFEAQRESREILDSVARLEIETLRTVPEFGESFPVLTRARDMARRNAARFLVFGDGVQPEVETAIRKWSDRVAFAIDDERAKSLAKDIAFQHDAWSRVVSFEKILCPDCTGNLESRDRGRVFYPDSSKDLELALYERRPLGVGAAHSQVMVNKRIDLIDAPVVGSYRLLGWDPTAESGILFEIDFFVTAPWQLARHLEPRRPLVDYWNGGTQFEARNILISDPSSPEERMRLPGFRISPDHVTRSQFRSFLDGTGHVPSSEYQLEGDDRPVWVTLGDAQAFCQWVGGRLPNTHELITSFEEDALSNLRPSAGGFGEWVVDQVSFSAKDLSAYFSYTRFAKLHEEGESLRPAQYFKAASASRLPNAAVEGAARGIAFRVAFTSDRDLAY